MYVLQYDVGIRISDNFSEVPVGARLPRPDGREAQRPSPDEEADRGHEPRVGELRARGQPDRSLPRLHRVHRRRVTAPPAGDLRDLHWRSSASVRRQDRLGEVLDGHRRRGGRDRQAPGPPGLHADPVTKRECLRCQSVHGRVRMI